MPINSLSRISRPKSASHSGIVSVVLVYAVFAALWVLLSDQLMQIFITDPERLIWISMLKGWLFVGITTVLLYGLMLRWVGSVDVFTDIPNTSRWFSFPFLLLVVIILLFTVTSVINTRTHHKQTEIAKLQAIADLKAIEVIDWLKERQRNVDFVQTSSFFAEHFQRWQGAGDLQSGQQLQKRLEQFAATYGFAAVSLFDVQGNRLWGSSKAPLALSPDFQPAVAKAIAGRNFQRIGPARDAAGQIWMDFIVPLTALPGPVPIIVLHSNLSDWLMPKLQTWPLPSASGEILLFCRDGDQVLYLNDLRFRQPSTSNLTLPITTEKLLAAQALRGDVSSDGVVEGVDYRGIPTIGVVHAIDDTDWTLLAKLDQADLYAGVADDSAWISFAGLVTLFMSVAGFYLLRQGQQLALARSIQQSQEERLQALNLLGAIAESSNDAIFAKDLEGRYTLFNPAACRFVGKSAEEVLGRDDRYIFPAEQAERLMKVGKQVIATHQIQSQEEVLDMPDGERVFYATNGPLMDAEGNVTGIFGISRDITERKHAEMELKNSEQRFRSLFTMMPMPLAIIAQDGVVVAINERFINTFGFTVKDIPTSDAWWPLAYPDPDYRRSVMQAWGMAVERAILQNTDIEQMEYRITCKHGDIRDVLISGIKLGNEFLITHYDITERRIAEDILRRRERYQRALLDTFPFMVWLKDRDSNIIAANKAYAKVANVVNTDDLIGKSDLDYWAPELAEHYRADDRAVLESGQAKMIEEEITEAGRRLWIETYKSPVELDGKIIGTVGFAREITKRKIAENELLRRNDELERFNRAMVGRELEMVELKKQVNELSRQLGHPLPYSLSFIDIPTTTGDSK
ncbi:MAG: PAS domain S-box protein [Methylobacter sp.]|nr:PAS domain S-box protein [Methylobacter sp.]